MSDYQKLSLENNIKYLNMMFEVSTIANQTDDVYDLLARLKNYCSNIINSDDITFYLLENQRYKCTTTSNDNLRNSEFVEGDESNVAFWDAVSKAKLISMKNEQGAHLFKGFLEKNNILSLDPSHVRVFFSNQVPICFCFIKENNETPIESETVDNLNKIFDYMEPIVAKYHRKIKKNEEIIQLQKSLHNISILYNISQAVNFIDDLKRLLQVIIQKALITLDAEKGSLMLYDYSINALQVRIVSGLQDKKLEEAINNGAVQCAKIGIGEGIAGTVFLERKPIITNLGSADPRFIVKEVLSNTKSLLCVPLIAKGEVIGVINITNKKHDKLFNQKDLEFITSLANQAAIAIDNAKLYELATKDGMTKLYIYRHFYTLLENEIRRCSRYKRNMSLIIMDIDNFKKINDTYGHLTGDLILKRLAAVLQETVRKIDVPARYGGEEFVVILPETDKKDACVIAERIRKNIAQIEVKINETQTLSPTVSMGVAQYTTDGQEAKELINAADTALYYSKHNGKNMVSTFEKEGCKKAEIETFEQMQENGGEVAF
ncbi:MAG: sensor domain-containing diguanylate cyclase [Candidatus Gastranaerophilales bacterium]|nr:sensor domain-containing diguanylate cyclase [Candidatus Gastranaerophilales bacterium]